MNYLQAAKLEQNVLWANHYALLALIEEVHNQYYITNNNPRNCSCIDCMPWQKPNKDPYGNAIKSY